MRQAISNKVFALAIILLTVLDQALKYIAISSGHFLINEGGVWGIPISSKALYLLMFFIVILIAFYINVRIRSMLSTWGFILILSGSLSNIIDRFAREGVVDYIDIGFWPTFNSSDAFILVGVILVIIDLIRREKLSF